MELPQLTQEQQVNALECANKIISNPLGYTQESFDAAQIAILLARRVSELEVQNNSLQNRLDGAKERIAELTSSFNKEPQQ